MIKFNYSKLRLKMYEKKYTIKDLAKELGISSAALSNKLNNKVYFTNIEIVKISNILSLNLNEINEYFFSNYS